MALDGRRTLAIQQRELLAALTGCGPLPVGFDGEQVKQAGRQLIEKRWRNVCKVRPALAQALGADGQHLFASRLGESPRRRGSAWRCRPVLGGDTSWQGHAHRRRSGAVEMLEPGRAARSIRWLAAEVPSSAD